MNLIAYRNLLLMLALLASLPARAGWYEQSLGIMGTNVDVQVWAESASHGEQAIQAVFAEMQRINQLMSPYIEDSELSLLNKNAATNPVVVSKELFDLIALSVQMGERSNGAFDITFASVGFLYDYRKRTKPSQAQLEQQLAAISYRYLQLQPEQLSIFYQHPQVKIDLGGIAKGHAVDNAIAILKSMQIKHALVTAGGDTRLLGDRRGRPWMVGIRDPRNRDKQAVVLPLIDTAMSTSGDYERFFEEDGKRYHHILSPKTGQSANQVQSVSILGPQSVINDALSTTVFVLGVKEGIEMINRLAEYEAIVMDNNRRMHYSSGLEP